MNVHSSPFLVSAPTRPSSSLWPVHSLLVAGSQMLKLIDFDIPPPELPNDPYDRFPSLRHLGKQMLRRMSTAQLAAAQRATGAKESPEQQKYGEYLSLSGLGVLHDGLVMNRSEETPLIVTCGSPNPTVRSGLQTFQFASDIAESSLVPRTDSIPNLAASLRFGQFGVICDDFPVALGGDLDSAIRICDCSAADSGGQHECVAVADTGGVIRIFDASDMARRTVKCVNSSDFEETSKFSAKAEFVCYPNESQSVVSTKKSSLGRHFYASNGIDLQMVGTAGGTTLSLVCCGTACVTQWDVAADRVRLRWDFPEKGTMVRVPFSTVRRFDHSKSDGLEFGDGGAETECLYAVSVQRSQLYGFGSHSVCFWDFRAENHRFAFHFPFASDCNIVSVCRNVVYCGGRDGSLTAYDVRQLQEPLFVEENAHKRGVTALMPLLDGRLVSGSVGGNVTVWGRMKMNQRRKKKWCISVGRPVSFLGHYGEATERRLIRVEESDAMRRVELVVRLCCDSDESLHQKMLPYLTQIQCRDGSSSQSLTLYTSLLWNAEIDYRKGDDGIVIITDCGSDVENEELIGLLFGIAEGLSFSPLKLVGYWRLFAALGMNKRANVIRLRIASSPQTLEFVQRIECDSNSSLAHLKRDLLSEIDTSTDSSVMSFHQIAKEDSRRLYGRLVEARFNESVPTIISAVGHDGRPVTCDLAAVLMRTNFLSLMMSFSGQDAHEVLETRILRLPLDDKVTVEAWIALTHLGKSFSRWYSGDLETLRRVLAFVDMYCESQLRKIVQKALSLKRRRWKRVEV